MDNLIAQSGTDPDIGATLESIDETYGLLLCKHVLPVGADDNAEGAFDPRWRSGSLEIGFCQLTCIQVVYQQ